MRWVVAITLAIGIACKARDITSPAPGTVLAAARDSFFTPDTIHVTVGNRVRWTNEGTVYHSVASDSSLWASDPLRPAWWFEVRFDSAGTFTYHCAFHASMIGTVVVAP